MTFYEFQVLASRTANSKLSRRDAVANFALGLAGEAGETADYLKKVLFHGKDYSPDKLVSELGDVLWYVAALTYTLGLSLDKVAEANVAKLKRRYPDGFVEGGGNGREEA